MNGEILNVEAPCDNFTPANVDGRCEHCGDSYAAHELAKKMAGAEALCRFYFDIASEALGEHEVRRRRDVMIAGAAGKLGAAA